MSHIHEKIDFTSSALVVHDGKVLLRLHDKYNIWAGIGGHIELDEDPVEALFREVREESGLEIEVLSEGVEFSGNSKNLPLPNFVNRHTAHNGHDHIDFVYIVRAKTTDIKPHPDESITDFMWFTEPDLDNPIYNIQEHTKQHARAALQIASELNI